MSMPGRRPGGIRLFTVGVAAGALPEGMRSESTQHAITPTRTTTIATIRPTLLPVIARNVFFSRSHTLAHPVASGWTGAAGAGWATGAAGAVAAGMAGTGAVAAGMAGMGCVPM
jgi:hypothetical protein